MLTLRGPLDARRAGIAMIHQELQQVPRAHRRSEHVPRSPLRRGSVFVDAPPRSRPPPRRSALDPTIRPDAPIKSLKVAQRQIVEIARALLENATHPRHGRADIEPDSQRIRTPGVVIADLAARGVSIIYVSHKMDEVFKVCSRGDHHARRAARRRSRPEGNDRERVSSR